MSILSRAAGSSATYMLSAILQKRTGETLTRYLTPRLFRPLGIPVPQWDSDPDGVNLGGFGLNLDTRSIARFGQFLLQKGCWNGRQLLNPEWIEEATSFQVENFGEKDWGQGYGYQFWRCVPEGVYRGDGACGQYCVVCPRQEMVLAVNSGSNDMQAILDLFWEHILPTVQEDPLPPDPSQQRKLGKNIFLRLGIWKLPIRRPTESTASRKTPAGCAPYPSNWANSRLSGSSSIGTGSKSPSAMGSGSKPAGCPPQMLQTLRMTGFSSGTRPLPEAGKKMASIWISFHTRTLFTDHYHFQLTEGGLKLTIQRSLIGKKGAFELFGFREEDHD